MEFNKETLNQFRGDFNSAIKSLQEKYGITIQMNSIRYDDNGFQSKLTVVNSDSVDENSKVNPKWKTDFLRNTYSLGFKPEDFGKVVKYQGKTGKIAGAQPRKPNLIVELQGRFYAVPAAICSLA